MSHKTGVLQLFPAGSNEKQKAQHSCHLTESGGVCVFYSYFARPDAGHQ